MTDYLEPEFEDLAWSDEVGDEGEYDYPYTTQGDGDYDRYSWLSSEVYDDLHDPYDDIEDDRDYYLGDTVD